MKKGPICHYYTIKDSEHFELQQVHKQIANAVYKSKRGHSNSNGETNARMEGETRLRNVDTLTQMGRQIERNPRQANPKELGEIDNQDWKSNGIIPFRIQREEISDLRSKQMVVSTWDHLHNQNSYVQPPLASISWVLGFWASDGFWRAELQVALSCWCEARTWCMT